MKCFTYSEMKTGQEQFVSDMVWEVFEEVGMARVIGDGGMTLYVQDVIVHPIYQRQGIGKKLMEFVMNYIKSSASEGSILQVSLMASKGKEAFYERFGFFSRPNEKQGAGMQQRICIGKAEE